MVASQTALLDDLNLAGQINSFMWKKWRKRSILEESAAQKLHLGKNIFVQMGYLKERKGLDSFQVSNGVFLKNFTFVLVF